jgi:DNA-binding transcriptional ArsR family regulator
MLDGNTQWVHIFKAMFESGDVAQMSPEAFVVYCCIKIYVSWKEGISTPSVDIIAQRTGLSERHILRCLKKLEDMGYLTRCKQGRKNVYTLREKVRFTDKNGRPAAVATFDYLPSLIKQARAELDNFKLTGDDSKTSVVLIQKLIIENINIVQGDQIQGDKLNVDLGGIKDPFLRKKMDELLQTYQTYTHDRESPIE